MYVSGISISLSKSSYLYAYFELLLCVRFITSIVHASEVLYNVHYAVIIRAVDGLISNMCVYRYVGTK